MHQLVDLPVSVELPTALAAEVTAYVETEAGWQVVAPGGPPPPVLAITSTPTPSPCVVLTEGTVAPQAAAEALAGGALDVIAWPDERARLLTAPLRIAPVPPRGPLPAIVEVAGAGGGVGASTVALAAAGLAAWGGARTVVVGGDDLLVLAGLAPWDGAGATQLASLDADAAAAEVPLLVRAVPAVAGLFALGGGTTAGPFAGWPYDVVVIDRRASVASASLVVAARDASLREAATATAPVVLRDRGCVPLRAVRRVLGDRLVAVLPESVRVTRAAVAGRVPSALPGSWLHHLKRALQGGAA